MSTSNRLVRSVAPFQSLPPFLRTRAQTLLLRRAVPFAGTAQLVFEEVTAERVSIRLANTRRVQNHIKGVHASAAALLAETATGFIVGLNLPDDKVPLLRSMKIDYTRRAEGGLHAEAHLTAEQREAFAGQPKGDVTVPVTVTDSTGVSPMVCEFVWAWTLKKKH